MTYVPESELKKILASAKEAYEHVRDRIAALERERYELREELGAADKRAAEYAGELDEAQSHVWLSTEDYDTLQRAKRRADRVDELVEALRVFAEGCYLGFSVRAPSMADVESARALLASIDGEEE